MATLRGEEIPVFYDYDQAGLRLLELPQEVLESIQAGDSKYEPMSYADSCRP